MRKVLVIEDSALMRRYISDILVGAGYKIEYARDGLQGLEKLIEFSPDVITLDINMPKMDGLECLEKIMATKPTPVVMVSSVTEKGAIATLEALEKGAVDYVAKPGGSISSNMKEVEQILLAKIKSALSIKVSSSIERKSNERLRAEKQDLQKPKIQIPKRSFGAKKFELVLIGVSTGGPSVLQDIIPHIPEGFPVPIVIAQHMPSRFTQVFSERLNKASNVSVQEISGTLDLQAGNVYIAKGDSDVIISRRGGKLVAEMHIMDKNHLWHPSVELMVNSALKATSADNLICVQLTGMGNDGASAMTTANQRGAHTIAESEETAAVFGMPRELIQQGGASEILPNTQILDALLRLTK
ncbi:chemotaxis-specific protein-glutamate methyltransferase CheB [Agaribacter marinus]|uniref:Protein-glutamate methylesterase/protein-glutamine glutaminase n=1 Tax=Agaribacter marinus TaxID=1431249 RepID=A0AA37SZ60_9ALTE|nr:chemotaxis-specific protein-glutamate methyltransferase CheB [Agaribacter marinus]GLR72126.1 chemotaxis response regulator protein-glutamate methylesterase 3 [Agaribacter marinus]